MNQVVIVLSVLVCVSMLIMVRLAYLGQQTAQLLAQAYYRIFDLTERVEALEGRKENTLADQAAAAQADSQPR